MKKIKFWLVLLAFVFALISPVSVWADVPSAVTYLKAQTQDAWVTQALAATSQTNIGTDHLKTVAGTLATDYAKTILAVAATNQNPATFGNIDYVAKLKTFYNNHQIGDASLINDDIWGLLALAAVKDTSAQEFIDAKDYILNHQNTDGGWSYATTGQSDTNDTAAAIIALVEAGVSSSDSKITQAINYLKTAQNADGGFGYQPGNDSDSGSDAWVITALNKLNQNPASWSKGNNTPITHLQSLQDTDGGFWWVKPGTSDFNNKAMTAYAVIALSNKSFPVGYYQSLGTTTPQTQTYHLRLEGQNSTICETDAAGTTALDLIKNAATICGYTYNITQESFGSYLRGINSETAQGLAGWLYYVNHTSPSVGAGDYQLAANDSVLFYYGQWGWNPTKLVIADTSLDVGQSIDIFAKYFNGTDWLPLPNAVIKVNDTTRTADATGKLTLTFETNGINELYVNTPDFVRSQKTKVTVGNVVNDQLAMQVEIDQTGTVAGSSIGLIITPDVINFGKLKPGETSTKNITVQNDGSDSLTINATISGDSVFTSGIKIDGKNSAEYSQTLLPRAGKDTAINLSVPLGYTGSGVKTGEIIFWAVK